MDHDPLERSIAFRRSTISAGIMLDESFVNPHCYFVDFLLVLAMRMRDKATKCRAPLWTKHIAGRSMEKWADEKQIKKKHSVCHPEMYLEHGPSWATLAA